MSTLLAELRKPSSLANQIAALRAIKNEIIGHGEKKEEWVTAGVFPCLAQILDGHRSSFKPTERDGNGSQGMAGRTGEEEVQFQAITIVGSLAQGKQCFQATKPDS